MTMDFEHVATRDWVASWSSEPIHAVHKRVVGAQVSSIEPLMKWPALLFERDSLSRYFGLSDNHFLHRHALDWDIHLTEPQATRALAHCIMARHREARIGALLAGLGIVAKAEDLDDSVVVAEEKRVDLLILWQGRQKAAIVEAKFGHKVTQGQLSKYGAYVRRAYKLSKPEKIVLLVDPDEKVRFRGPQSRQWRILSWAALLMRMERALPAEADDDDFRLLRRMIWQRCGGLQQGRNG